MTMKLNRNLKWAILVSLLLNTILAFSGFYAKAADSYGHMFFADHYQKSWFNPWEGRWYMGFNVEGYPPLAHQILALFGFITGLELAYVLITLGLMVLLPVAVFKFSQVFISEEAAGDAALLSIFLPGLLYAAYGWGQFTTLFGLVIILFTVSSLNNFIKKGGFLPFTELLCLFEMSIASHHFSGLLFSPLFLFVTLLTIIVKKEVDFTTAMKRFLLFVGVGVFLSVVIVYPVLYGAVGQNVNVPHPTTMNYLQDTEIFRLFFTNLYGFFLLLIPFTGIIIAHRRDLFPLFTLAVFFLILGLGGTTILPQLVFGENWLGLTYERFGLFASILFLPLFGLIFATIKRKKHGKIVLEMFLLLCLFFATNNVISRPSPQNVPVESLVNFLNSDYHWRWRYLTLGFHPADFCKLTVYANASTLDGWYYRGRAIRALANSGVGYLSDAKFEKNGISVLRSILENSSQYHLRFIFCNDNFYDPLLKDTGFTLLNETFEQVTVWVKYDSPPLEIREIVRTDQAPSLFDSLWGILPISWLIGLFLVTIFRLLQKRALKAQS